MAAETYEALMKKAIAFGNARNPNMAFCCSLEKIENFWPFGIRISAKEVVEKSSNTTINLLDPVLEYKSYQLFLEAKNRQETINDQHPAQGNFALRVSRESPLGRNSR